MKRISIFVLALSLLAACAPAADNANDLFQQALVKERMEGNLPEAIKLYQKIIDKSGNRKVAARALLQLADCQSKLGDVQSRFEYAAGYLVYVSQSTLVARPFSPLRSRRCPRARPSPIRPRPSASSAHRGRTRTCSATWEACAHSSPTTG